MCVRATVMWRLLSVTGAVRSMVWGPDHRTQGRDSVSRADQVGSLGPRMAATPKRAAVQAAVLEATERLLAEGASWADLGVEHVARAAGISRTAFCFYFKDKRELLLHLTEDVVEQLYAEAERWFSGEDDVTEALAGIGRLYDEHGTLL